MELEIVPEPKIRKHAQCKIVNNACDLKNTKSKLVIQSKFGNINSALLFLLSTQLFGHNFKLI